MCGGMRVWSQAIHGQAYIWPFTLYQPVAIDINGILSFVKPVFLIIWMISVTTFPDIWLVTAEGEPILF